MTATQARLSTRSTLVRSGTRSTLVRSATLAMLERLARARGAQTRYPRLLEIFTRATLLEAAFWETGWHSSDPAP